MVLTPNNDFLAIDDFSSSSTFFVGESPFYETVSLNFFKRRASLIVGGVYHLRKKHFLVPTFCVFSNTVEPLNL